MILHTFLPQDMISAVMETDPPEYIKYNGRLCKIRRDGSKRIIEGVVSTNPYDYLEFTAVGKNINNK